MLQSYLLTMDPDTLYVHISRTISEDVVQVKEVHCGVEPKSNWKVMALADVPQLCEECHHSFLEWQSRQNMLTTQDHGRIS